MPKIQLDVDRNIYPSKDPEFEYQANCKTGSVYFNRTNGDLGFYFCPNLDKADWSSIKRMEGTWHSILPYNVVLPVAPIYEVDGNKITYTYPGGKIQLQISVEIDGVRRLIILKEGLAVQALDLHFAYEKPVGFTKEQTVKKVIIKDSTGKVNTEIRTIRAWDSAQVLPCCSSSHLCGKAGENNCSKICSKNCPRKDVRLCPMQYPNEDLEVYSDSVKLLINSDWLNSPDRVFPIYINDEITGWQGGASIALAGKFDGGNASSTLYDGTKTANSGVGGDCGVGDTAYIAQTYGTDCIDLDLGGSYTVEDVKVWVTMAGDTEYDVGIKLQYDDVGWNDFGSGEHLDVGACSVSVPLDFDVTDQITSKIRVTVKCDGVGSRNRCYVDEIEIYGTAAGGGRTTKNTGWETKGEEAGMMFGMTYYGLGIGRG